MSIWFEGYGCTANQGETVEMRDHAMDLGHEIALSSDNAETVVMGTCTVIESTQNKMERRISELMDQGKNVIVSGCMATADTKRLNSIFPEAPLISPGDIEGLGDLIGRGGCKPEKQASPLTTILPISSGCLGRCNYCATLRARGRVTSRSVNDIFFKAQYAIDSGSRELLLTSQDNGAFGADNDSSLENLLNELSHLEGDFRLRVGMLNPMLVAGRSEKMARAWSDNRTYKFMHLPIQSGSQTMLDAMLRDHNLEDFWEVVETFRSHYPEMMIITDIITGFPGETDEDHQATIELLRRLLPDLVNITRFSPRTGTPAARYRRINGNIVKTRSRELTLLRQGLATKSFRRFVGRRTAVLAVENQRPGSTLCRDDNYRPIIVKKELPLGEFYDVEIIDSDWAYLTAIL
ncbi:MAG: tRNA (N(6)-L-threonylcarbamoyladenosine(37)-C(2))-methylthiotransferase [Candidatus Thermoplasmatota archaeon]|nr:tRNA (N(6)-L-threonylcarbamoyladenosine(37)-C(2))-methylthiotransferase [Candidatus Thermoplasmatota archaeon]